MTAAARASPRQIPTAATGERALPPFPTAAALALERSSRKALETAFVRGATPDVDALIGGSFAASIASRPT